jgi:hypothetical protein
MFFEISDRLAQAFRVDSRSLRGIVEFAYIPRPGSFFVSLGFRLVVLVHALPPPSGIDCYQNSEIKRICAFTAAVLRFVEAAAD